jgi:hypothetical protein
VSEIKIACPNCNQLIAYDESYHGMQANCPACGMLITVPVGDTKLLTCPGDSSKSPTTDWKSLDASRVNYLLGSGPGLSDSTPNEVPSRCPIRGHTVYCEGQVEAHR